jgi:membrane-associated phospholipid phosphatase
MIMKNAEFDNKIETGKLYGASRFAKVISYIFDGSVLVLPMFFAACFYKQENFMKMLPSFAVSSLFAAFIPYFFILFLYKSRKLNDLHIPKRRERLLPLLILNISIFAGLPFLLLTDPSKMMKSVYTIYMIGVPVVTLITLFWKISFHSGFITMFSVVFLIIFGSWAVFTLLLIPLVCWARLKLKRHTPVQVFYGAVLTGTIALTVFYYAGYLSSQYWAISQIQSLFKNASYYLNIILLAYGINIIFQLIFLIILFQSRKLKANLRLQASF